MKTIFLPLLIVFTLNSFAQTIGKISITIDDLPFRTKYPLSAEKEMKLNIQLLEALKKHRATAIGFVNESRLYTNNKIDSSRVKIIEKWLAYGMDIGNHTKNHIDYNTHSINNYGKDILDGQIITNQLLKKYNRKVKYFRHPFLHRGNSKEKIDSLASFLKINNLIEAPVTIDNSDWIFAQAYDSLILIKGTETMKKIGQEYLSYMEKKLKYFQKQCDTIFKREISQVLILHVNSINADYLDQLLTLYEHNGYSFISLDEALKDKIYQTEDKFYQGAGITWIHRWAISQKVSTAVFAGEPLTPIYIMKLAGVENE
jgi:peptidoglycan/xylan/chitin deacetylase (PgdA/CDA1 family)